jgi:predicted dehydrogenase
MSDTLRLALVGCGAISAVHIDSIGKAGAPIEITAVVDLDEARANAAAQRTGARAFTSLDDALASDTFDAVDVMLPHHLHEAAATACFAAGRHVLLEKPMAPSVEACARILEAASASGRVFMVAENAQYWPDVLTAREAIAGGAIGDPVTARAAIFFPPLEEYYGAVATVGTAGAVGAASSAGDAGEGDRPWRMDRSAAGGGVAIDGGSHWIRPLRMLMGEIDEVVAALGTPFAGMEGESLVRALLRFRGGELGSFDALLTSAPVGPEVFFRVTGSTGEITIDGLGRVVLYDGRNPGKGEVIGRSTGYFESYPPEFADFAAAVLEGQPLAAGPEESLGELRAALAMYRSAEAGRWEKVWGDD